MHGLLYAPKTSICSWSFGLGIVRNSVLDVREHSPNAQCVHASFDIRRVSDISFGCEEYIALPPFSPHVRPLDYLSDAVRGQKPP